MSITIFSSPIGLGHATRDIAIASKLPVTPKFVSGIGAAQLIAKYGYSVINAYSPNKFSVKSGMLQHTFSWLLGYYLYYRKCRTAARRFLSQNGGLVVSDEDFASLAIAQELKRPCILITDITQTHFTNGPASIVEQRMNERMRRLMERCDCVLIPDNGDNVGNRIYVGPIVREPRASREQLRKIFRFDRVTILLCVGGTDAGQFLIEKATEAFQKLRIEAELVIVSGPSLSLPDSEEYRNMGFVDNSHEIILASDLVVSLAGRSTMDESLASGTPGIFIPIKNHFEQERGAARLGFKHEDVYRLEQLMAEKVTSRNSPSKVNGAGKAAEIISSYL